MTSSEVSIRIVGVEPWEPPDGEPGRGMLLRTTRGDVNVIVHNNQEGRATKGVIWVWGARGGFAGPAGGLYRDLAEELKQDVTSVRIDYRMPNNIQECVMDTLVGVSFPHRNRPYRNRSRRALLRWSGRHNSRAI